MTSPRLPWERIDSGNNGNEEYGQWILFRLKVPGGWLVRIMSDSNTGAPIGGMGSGAGLTYIPDPGHTWKP